MRTIKVITLTVAGFVAMLAAAAESQATPAASASFSATATVVSPIAIAKNADLAFGKFIANTGGTVVVSTTGARSQTGNVSLISLGSTQTAASFAVTGEGTSGYAITLPTSATIASGGGNTMTVGTFNSNPSGTGVLTAGAQTLLVGGTLTVTSGQATGNYTGSFSIGVDYN